MKPLERKLRATAKVQAKGWRKARQRLNLHQWAIATMLCSPPPFI